MRKYVAALVGYTALLGCTSEPITSGTGTQKHYEPERVYNLPTEDFWTGKEIRTTFIDDEDCMIVLQQFGGTKFKGTRERQLYLVSKAVYDSLKVGDFVDLRSEGIHYDDTDKDVEQK